MATRLYPKYRVLCEQAGALVPALWPDGEPAWRTGRDEERARAAAIRDAHEIAELDPEAELVVVDPDGAEIHRVCLAACPF